MGKLNVALLRYLSREDFRVLTAVSLVISKSRSTKHHNSVYEDDFFMIMINGDIIISILNFYLEFMLHGYMYGT